MGKKYWNGVIDMMGYIAIIYLAISLIFSTAIDSKDMLWGTLIGAFCYTTAFFTFELRLFSKNLWVRRSIVITVSVIFVVTVNLLSQDLTKSLLLAIGVSAAVIVVMSVLLYYITDKIEQRRLEAINKKLAQNQKENDI